MSFIIIQLFGSHQKESQHHLGLLYLTGCMDEERLGQRESDKKKQLVMSQEQDSFLDIDQLLISSPDNSLS